MTDKLWARTASGWTDLGEVRDLQVSLSSGAQPPSERRWRASYPFLRSSSRRDESSQFEREYMNQPSGTTGPERDSETTRSWRREQLGSYTDASGTGVRPARLYPEETLGPLGTVVRRDWVMELHSWVGPERGRVMYVLEQLLPGEAIVREPSVLEGTLLDVFSHDQMQQILSQATASGINRVTLKLEESGTIPRVHSLTFEVRDLRVGWARDGNFVLVSGQGTWRLILLETSLPSSGLGDADGRPGSSGSTRSGEASLPDIQEEVRPLDAREQEQLDGAMRALREPVPAPVYDVWTEAQAEGQPAAQTVEEREGDYQEEHNFWRDDFRFNFMSDLLLYAHGTDRGPTKRKVCITTNGSVRKDGRAVMGRGIALGAKKKFKDLDLRLGRLLTLYGNRFQWLEGNVYAFPVKHRWMEEADIELIKKSAAELAEVANEMDGCQFFLPLPGCDNGRLDFEKVVPAIHDILPQNVVFVTNDRKVRDRISVLQGVTPDDEGEDRDYF